MKLSVVSTLYGSAPYIEEFHRRVSAAARQLTHDYEIVLVNDGSPDDSLARAVALTDTDDHVVVVDLSRNFGHHKAMMTGLAQARGEMIFLIDSDLEEEPEWLQPFWEQMTRERCDVVHGVQVERKGGLLERWTGVWYYILHRAVTGLNIPYNITTARLMSRRYVDALMLFQEREIDIGGLWYIAGFDQRSQVVKKHSTSRSTYTFGKKVAIIINSITSFSNRPLITIFYVGITILLAACAYSAYLIVHWLLDAQPISGWTSVMVSIWLLGGVILSSVGVVGMYLAKVFLETKRRPITIIREIYGKHKHI
jgi:putative glycosyltransferase